MDKKEEFDKQAEAFKQGLRKGNLNEGPIRRRIYHTDREYIVKLPAEIMKAVYKEGDSLVFKLKTIVKNDKSQNILEIEYQSADEEK